MGCDLEVLRDVENLIMALKEGSQRHRNLAKVSLLRGRMLIEHSK
eukprot:gene13506-biopygen16617